MNKDKIVSLIDKLAEETKTSKIKWDRIVNIDDSYSDNKMLRLYLNIAEKEFFGNIISEKIVKETSYYTKYKGGNVMLLGMYDFFQEKDVFMIAVQNDNNAKVSPLNTTDIYQSELMRLQFLIEEQLSDVNGFIDSILDD